jgi:hypothetical protein
MKASQFMATFSSAGNSGGFAPREQSVNPNNCDNRGHSWRGIDSGRMCADCGLIEKQHQGDTISNLYAQVDNVLALSRIRNSAICENCWQTLGEHSHFGSNCPSTLGTPGPLYLSTKFVQITCQACVIQGAWDEGQECGRTVIEGTEFCTIHQETS